MTGTTTTPCRALVAGFGRPGMRDLDFGRQIIDYLKQLEWPDGVVVEDLSLAAPLVLHRLQELRPAKLVLVGAVPRDVDPPATLRRRHLDLQPMSPDEVQRRLADSMMEMVDIDHTMGVVRHWGEVPVDTVVIEVEPAEISFGPGFSEELAGCVDPILDMVRRELAGVTDEAWLTLNFDAGDLAGDGPAAHSGTAGAEPRTSGEPSEEFAELQAYAAHHAQARLDSHLTPAPVDGLSSGIPGVALAGRLRPWGVFVQNGGDWFDAVALESGCWGIVVGDVAGRGVGRETTMWELRAAARAYAVLEGDSPARVVGHLDRLAEVTGLGDQARLVYLLLQPETGDIRFSSAGNCPPLVLYGDARGGSFVDEALAVPLGAMGGADRPETTLRLARGSTLILFTDGLVESRATSRAEGLACLRRAALEGPHRLEDLCDHVVRVCSAGIRRDDDICLVGMRRRMGS